MAESVDYVYLNIFIAMKILEEISCHLFFWFNTLHPVE